MSTTTQATPASYSTLPQDVDLNQVKTDQPEMVSAILNQYGVAVMELSDISLEDKVEAIRNTKLYSNANSIFDMENQIEDLTMEEKLNPATCKVRKAPDFAQGMVHQYGTPIHQLIQSSGILRSTMDILYGANCKYAPNRLRISRKYKLNDASLHIEGLDIFNRDEESGEIELLPGEIATIVGLSGTRRFVFWDLNGQDIEPIYNLWQEKEKEFTTINPEWMHQNYPGRRRMVTMDCSNHPMLIIWKESTPHEIVGSPALSCFISPIKDFIHDRISKVTSAQPIEYCGLTQHETDLVGLCYQLPGSHWPSGKKTYALCHYRAYSHYGPKIRNEFMENGKFQMRLISGNVDQHTPEYREGLEDRGIVLPEIMFLETTPNMVNDIMEWSDTILRDYGFIE